MANDLNRSIKLYIDGSEATNKIDLVKESISRLEDKLRSLTGKEVDYAKRSQDLKKELDAKNRTLQNYEKQLAETEPEQLTTNSLLSSPASGKSFVMQCPERNNILLLLSRIGVSQRPFPEHKPPCVSR